MNRAKFGKWSLFFSVASEWMDFNWVLGNVKQGRRSRTHSEFRDPGKGAS